MNIRSIFLTLTLAFASTMASAVTVVSGNVGPSEWGIVEFTHSGGNLDIGSPAFHSGSTLDDPFLTLFVNNGSPFTAFTGAFVGSDDDGGSGLDALLSLNLAAGDYVVFVSHCCTAFSGSTSANSGIHTTSADPFITWFVTFSQDVTVSAAAEVPEPGSLALLSLGLVGLAASRKRKQA